MKTWMTLFGLHNARPQRKLTLLRLQIIRAVLLCYMGARPTHASLHICMLYANMLHIHARTRMHHARMHTHTQTPTHAQTYVCYLSAYMHRYV